MEFEEVAPSAAKAVLILPPIWHGSSHAPSKK
jgi:hypothetical protein